MVSQAVKDDVHSAEGVMGVSTRERIMTIRLMDKVSKHPMYAVSLGIEIVTEMGGTEDACEPP